MDIRFISSLLEVVETGSIAAAARNQNLTPAAVSQRIKALEDALGCELLSRAGHKAKPTADCLSMLPRMKHLVAESKALKGDMDKSGLTGPLNVGVISTALTGLLPDVIEQLAEEAPKLSLQIKPGTSDYLYQQLINRKLDAIIAVQPPFSIPKYLHLKQLFDEPLVYISHQQNSLNMEQSFKQKPFIQYDKSSWGGMLASQYLADHNHSVNTLCELDALESIALMVQKGMGVSIVPAWCGLTDIAEQIVAKDIKNSSYSRKIMLLSHRQAGKEPLIKKFSEVVAQQIKS